MKEQEQKKKSCLGICCLIECLIILALSCGVLVLLALHFGTEDQHADVPHILSQVFQSEAQLAVQKQLGKKSHRYAIMVGSGDEGLFHFMEYYADMRAEKGKFVIVRKQESDETDLLTTALKLARSSKEMIDENLEIDEKRRTEWVFIIRKGEVPVEEIEIIRSKYPKDRILIGTETETAIEGFKNVELPQISVQELEAVITEEFALTEQEAQILTRHFGTIDAILNNLDTIAYSPQFILPNHYHDLTQYPELTLDTLSQLCVKGKVKISSSIPQQQLQPIGVVQHKGTGYWKDNLNILNFELFKKVNCKQEVASPLVLEAIEKEREQRKEKEEKELGEKAKDGQSVQKSKKKSKSSKKKNNKK